MRYTQTGIFSIRSLEPGYRAILVAANADGVTTPTAAGMEKENRLFADWWSVGFIQKMDVLYVFTHDSSAEAFNYYNWVNPSANKITKVGTTTFTSKDGVKSNGTTGYYNTNFSCLSHGVRFTSDAGYVCVTKETTAEDTYTFGRTDSGSTNHVLFRPRIVGDVMDVRINQTTNGLTAANTDGSGFFVGEKIGASTTVRGYRDDVLMGQRTDAPADSRPSGNVYIMCRNNGGSGAANFSTKTVRVVGLGGVLTQLQRESARAAWNLYFNSL